MAGNINLSELSDDNIKSAVTPTAMNNAPTPEWKFPSSQMIGVTPANQGGGLFNPKRTTDILRQIDEQWTKDPTSLPIMAGSFGLGKGKNLVQGIKDFTLKDIPGEIEGMTKTVKAGFRPEGLFGKRASQLGDLIFGKAGSTRRNLTGASLVVAGSEMMPTDKPLAPPTHVDPVQAPVTAPVTPDAGTAAPVAPVSAKPTEPEGPWDKERRDKYLGLGPARIVQNWDSVKNMPDKIEVANPDYIPDADRKNLAIGPNYHTTKNYKDQYIMVDNKAKKDAMAQGQTGIPLLTNKLGYPKEGKGMGGSFLPNKELPPEAFGSAEWQDKHKFDNVEKAIADAAMKNPNSESAKIFEQMQGNRAYMEHFKIESKRNDILQARNDAYMQSLIPKAESAEEKKKAQELDTFQQAHGGGIHTINGKTVYDPNTSVWNAWQSGKKINEVPEALRGVYADMPNKFHDFVQEQMEMPQKIGGKTSREYYEDLYKKDYSRYAREMRNQFKRRMAAEFKNSFVTNQNLGFQ